MASIACGARGGTIAASWPALAPARPSSAAFDATASGVGAGSRGFASPLAGGDGNGGAAPVTIGLLSCPFRRVSTGAELSATGAAARFEGG
jgi:hypothetical protein